MTATLIGATGFIGNYLLNLLLQDTAFDTVRILIRRPIDISHPKLEKKLVNFNDAESFRLALEEPGIIFCSIGTTQKKVKGDKAAYRKIDYDIAVNAAKFGKMAECEKFVLVSSVGANSKSNNFYLQLKGEIEDAIQSIGISSVHIMRPSVLTGQRKEARPLEKISKVIMSAVSFLIPSKYKPVQGKQVGKAMITAAKKNGEGIFVYEYKDIMRLQNN